jgi:hypothetical protein
MSGNELCDAILVGLGVASFVIVALFIAAVLAIALS